MHKLHVMNTETLQWSTAAHLLRPVLHAPGAVCGDHVYILLLRIKPLQVYLHENSKKFIFITIPKPRGIPPSVCSGTSNLDNPMQKAEPSLGALALRTRGGRLKSSFVPWYTCPVSALIQSCRSESTADVWNEFSGLLVGGTTCVSILGRLLTIGGVDSNNKPITAVYMYNPDSDSWEVISHMATPRYDCFAAVLSNNQLMVVECLLTIRN